MSHSPRVPRAWRAASIGFALVTLLAPAGAQEKKPAAPPPTVTPAAPKTAILTPAQLRDCELQKEKVAKDTDAVVKARAALDADKAEIERSGKALDEQATTLDRTSADAVTAFNAKVLERNARIDAFQARAAAYNTDADNVLALKEARDKACANRRYDERDLQDLQRKK